MLKTHDMYGYEPYLLCGSQWSDAIGIIDSPNLNQAGSFGNRL